jgi:hypothetical protein
MFLDAAFWRGMASVFWTTAYSASGWRVPGMIGRCLFLGGGFALGLNSLLFGRLNTMLRMVVLHLRMVMLHLTVVVLRRLFLAPANAERQDHDYGERERRELANAQLKPSMG